MKRLLIAFTALLGVIAAGCHQKSQPTSPDNLAGNGAAPASAPATQGKFGGVTVRAPDAFYDAPAEVPSQPGKLLRVEPLKDVALPAGVNGWRILYTTSIDDKTHATAVATVFAPANPPAGPRPVITWEHGTTGLMQKCMPSLVSVPTMGIPALGDVAKAGWVIVATDYSFAEKGGPHPYLIGEGEARAALNSVRAARQIPGLVLDKRTVVWGHSQGGGAALWTGIVGPNYAPDVPILGVAAIAPAADMADILKRNPAVDKRLGPYLALAYSRFYPDVKFDQAIRPEALPAAREISGLCGFLPQSDPQRIAALAKSFEGPALALDTDPALMARIRQNSADRPIKAPLLVAQGLTDIVVLPAATEAYVKARCAAGQQLEYWELAGLDHGGIVNPGSALGAPLAAWTADRFAGKAAVAGCTQKLLG